MRTHHPLHPILVHLPLGLLPVVAIADGAALFSGRPLFWEISFWVLVAGLMGAFFAMAAGVFDALHLSQESKVAPIVAKHMMWMGTAVSAFVVSLLLRSHTPPALPWLLLLLDVSGVGLLLVGGFYGGELVYRYGVGKITERADESERTAERG